jgi:hypothetical protein
MQKDRSQSNSSGFVLLEPILAGTLLLIVVFVITTTLVAGRESMALVSEQTQALYLAQEGIEAARSLRDSSFEELTPGTWGISREGSTWTFENEPDITGSFRRTVTIGVPRADVLSVTSTVTWDTGSGEREVELYTELTDWR